MDVLLIYKDRKFLGKQVLGGTEWVLGRGGDVVLDAPTVSRRHAAVRRKADHWVIADLGSANGTILNGTPLAGPHQESPLRHGDELEVGDFVVRCLFAPSEERLLRELAAAPSEIETGAAAEGLPAAPRPAGKLSDTVRWRIPDLPATERPRPAGGAEGTATAEQAGKGPAAAARAEPPAQPGEGAAAAHTPASPPGAPASQSADTLKLDPEAARRVAAAAEAQAKGAAAARPRSPAAGSRPGTAAGPERLARARARLIVATEELRNRIAIEKAETAVGRTPDCGIALGAPSVSPRHATIRFTGDGFEVVDHESKNLTFLNGVGIPAFKAVKLENHAALGFGAVSCLFLYDPEALDRAAVPPLRAPAEAVAEHLVQTGVITRAQAQDMLREAGEKGLDLGELVVLRGFLTPERWVEVYDESERYAAKPRAGRSGAMVRVAGAILAVAALLWLLYVFGILRLR